MKGREAQSQLGKTGAYIRRNGPRRRAARFRVLSSELIGARNGPRELEFQGASARRLVECRCGSHCGVVTSSPKYNYKPISSGPRLAMACRKWERPMAASARHPDFARATIAKTNHHEKTPDDHPKVFACAAVLSASTKPQKNDVLKKIWCVSGCWTQHVFNLHGHSSYCQLS